MLYWQLALAGVATGSIAALSGLGLVLTYRATGIFNFAHGAVAMFVAYLLWQTNIGWGWPLALSGIVAILIAGPVIGIVLERVVFRPLEVRRASTSEKLVATLGVFVVLVGLAQTIWGPVHKTDTPNLFPQTVVNFTSQLYMGANQLAEFVIVIVSAAALLAMFRYTHLGTRIRAVVDRRQLADLTGVNANRVAAIAWALGCGFAGLSGALLAPQLELDPFRLTLLVIDTFAVAVVARLTSLPLAVLSGIVLGVVSSELTSWNPPAPFDSLRPNLLVLTLLVALLIYRSLNERDEDAPSARGLVASGVGRERSLPARLRFLIPAALVATLVPFGLSGQDLSSAGEVVSLAVVLLSITAVTGFTGNITLGQAGFAGLGALASIHLHNTGLLFLPRMPVIAAMLVSSLLVGIVGAFAGYSALRRRGLFLGLTTLAIGLFVYRFMFENPYFLTNLDVSRPNLFGFSLDSDRAFYWFALVCLGVVLIGVDRMRRGKLGRKLAAMRDSEIGAKSIGLDLRAYKLLVFSASAAIAAFGGALLAQETRGFSPTSIGPIAFDPFHSLFWFTAVIVAGASYLSGAVVAAVLFVALDLVLGQGGSTLVIGVLALFMSRFPLGIVGTLMEAVQGGRAPEWLQNAYAATHRPPAAAFPDEPPLRPTEFATKVLQEVAK
ncbi:MAG: branched-chain amino acid transport system permease protein livM [Frankiaceae bacterium]|jgi:branched-chain amino acid transport system permease protein|nr:branched-chain amino acid transport system permease protein livM [Frankiaceae bacterium]